MSDDEHPAVLLGALRFDRAADTLYDEQDQVVALRPQSLSVLKALIVRQG